MSLKKGTTTISGLGTDGFSPIATVTKSGSTATISITDKNGTTTANVNDGESYTLPISNTTTLGGIKPDGSTITVDENGVASTTDNQIVMVLTSLSFTDEQREILLNLISDYIENDKFPNLIIKYKPSTLTNIGMYRLSGISQGNYLRETWQSFIMSFTVLYKTVYYQNIVPQKGLEIDIEVEKSGDSWGIKTLSIDNSNGYRTLLTKYTAGFGGLDVTNTEAFTPTGNYNPATKKYVDDKLTSLTGYDATKTQILKNVNGTLTWIDEA